MSDYTTTAASIIQSVINDGQVQTTNRSLLLDYVNRVQQKILRETQWLFLRSDPVRFITEPGVTDYWVGPSGGGVSSAMDTGLNLQDLDSIRGDEVYDLSNRKHLSFDTETRMATSQLRFDDGQYRSGKPLTHSTNYANPNQISIYPAPDSHNTYTPVPTTPVCTFTPGLSGSPLPNRLLYVTATLVDSFGNESAACQNPNIIGVPFGNLLIVEPPKLDVASATQILYNRWNVYIGTNPSNMTLQNGAPLFINGIFFEPAGGVSGILYPSTYFLASPPDGTVWRLGVLTSGLLFTSEIVSPPGFITGIYLSSGASTWLVSVTSGGLYQTIAVPPGTVTPAMVAPQIYLQDSLTNLWKVTVDGIGLLHTTFFGPLSEWNSGGPLPPTDNNLTPLYGYVIEFQYQVKRQFITDPSNVLQIPDRYRDIVISGVNYYANLYTAKSDDLAVKVGVHKTDFMQGLANIRRDLQINHKNVNVILPDNASQYYQVSGWGWLNPRP